MSLLSSIAEINVKMAEKIAYFNGSNNSVYFLGKKFAPKTASAIRALTNESGWWSINLDTNITKGSITCDPIGQVDEVFVKVNTNVNLIDFRETLYCFGFDLKNEDDFRSLIEEIENNHKLTQIGFYTKNFIPDFYEKLSDSSKDLINDYEIFNKMSIPTTLLKQVFNIDEFLIDFQEKSLKESLSDAPERINGYILTDAMRLNWPIFKSILEDGYKGVLRVMFHGIAGSGKTDFARALRYYFGCDMVEVDCSIVVEPNQWFYRRAVKNGETIDELTPMAQELIKDTEEPLIILLDELSRNNPMVLNPLMQLLGEQRNATIGQETFTYTRPVLFYVTANIGSQYTGTDLMDLALLSRMDAVIEQTPPKKEFLEEIALVNYGDLIEHDIVKKIATLVYEGMMYTVENEIPELVTNRDMLNVLKMIYLGSSVRTAVRYGIISKQSEHNRSHIEGIVNNTIL